MCIYIYIYICVCIYIYIYIYIYIALIHRAAHKWGWSCVAPTSYHYLMLYSGRNRFGSGLFDKSSVRFGSVRLGNLISSVWRGSACVFRTGRGSVRFGSVRFRIRLRPVPEIHGSVRFCSVRPVRFGFLFLPVSSSDALLSVRSDWVYRADTVSSHNLDSQHFSSWGSISPDMYASWEWCNLTRHVYTIIVFSIFFCVLLGLSSVWCTFHCLYIIYFCFLLENRLATP